MKIFLFKNSEKLSKDSKIGKLLKIADKTLTLKNPLITQTYIDGCSNLTLTMSNFDESDEATLKVVAHLVSFACALHATKPERVIINKDRNYGEGKLTISSSLNKLIDTLISSAQHPQGLFVGDQYNFSSGFKGTLVSILAAMRLLNRKSEFLRRRKFSDSSKSPTSYNVLQETFNSMSSLKRDNSLDFVINFTKAVLASSVKPYNDGFPGGWIHSSRAINGVKSDFALANILGWTEKVPSHHKMMEVLFNTVDPPSDTTGLKKDTVVNLTQDKRNFTHREFRTALALTLPRIRLSQGNCDDMLLDPFSVRSLKICNNFCSGKREILVDRLNESYGLRVSLKNPKSKTREVHYKNSRDRLLNASSNMPLIDGDGKEWQFSALPKKVQKFFRDKFRYPEDRKRDRTVDDTTDPDNADVGMTDATQPPGKRRKVTRGVANETVRKSGRLAALKSKRG
jgi:hypothetical protein